MKKSIFAVALLAAMAQPVLAQEWFVRAGATYVDPSSDNGKLAGLPADISSDTQLGITFGYHLNPNVAFELLAATPFSHSVSLQGLGKVANFKQLPPTLNVQYYFMPEAKVSPYIGAGFNYTMVYDVDAVGALAGQHVEIGDSWGMDGQLGLRFNFSNNWDMTIDARYIGIDAGVKLNGVGIGTAEVNPMVYSLMLGKRF
ncbi:MAG: outer membrane beta-barrel protein [Arenimonas sp.]|nr:outer membrane beta-barrel protein [Arenimonas sp.]